MSALLSALSLCAATPLQALPAAASPLARDFAYCAGRLSAEAQHREDQSLNELKHAMQELLAAVIAPEEAEAYEELRLAGHVAQSELLALSRFSFDQGEADRASQLAQDSIRHCRAMLLGA
ncbi:hypothetical protein SAMN04488117_102386 [Celeribacter baekdonensis]|uniref:Uncharacterized protein n=1 Tax=Celeribacter baekdonensis TaxID=875171 RepID=A0A1G7IMI4_9RHOB|nr:hypothetical protein [Celeribacter baekdonensis]SDF13843.1 hypothetical protein SAMN04488117_102386 [Celeribacter baekdonensis]